MVKFEQREVEKYSMIPKRHQDVALYYIPNIRGITFGWTVQHCDTSPASVWSQVLRQSGYGDQVEHHGLVLRQAANSDIGLLSRKRLRSVICLRCLQGKVSPDVSDGAKDRTRSI